MKHLVEVEIPEGDQCWDRELTDLDCPFFDDEWCSCSNPHRVEWKEGDPERMCDERPQWCHDKYDPGPDIAIGSCRRNREAKP